MVGFVIWPRYPESSALRKVALFGHIWEVERPSAVYFFCLVSSILAWSSNFHHTAFFSEHVSPGYASALSSCSRNRYLKQKCLEQDADSWMDLHLETFEFVTQTFLSQFTVACAIYFKIISDCFSLFGRNPIVQINGQHPLLNGSRFI